MKTKYKSFVRPRCHPSSAVHKAVPILLLVVLACSAQTNTYLFTGSETTITLNPGLYAITAYGAQGGSNYAMFNVIGGLGAEMGAEFTFMTTTTLTLLVGGGGQGIPFGFDPAIGGGGGGGSFVVSGTTPLVIAGGGGGAGGGALSFDIFQSYGGKGAVGPSGGDGDAPGGTLGGGGGGSWGGGGGGYSGGGGGYAGIGSGSGGGDSFLSGGSGGSGINPLTKGGFGGGGGGAIAGGGGGGGGGGYSGGGGGGNPSPGGGGGSYINSSAVAVLTEVSGVAAPDGSPNGAIIITAISQIPLNYQVIDGKLVLDWASGTLLSAGTVNGTYTPVGGASSPYTNSMTGAQQYFRVH